MGIGFLKRTKPVDVLLEKYPQQPLVKTGKGSVRPLPDAHTCDTIDGFLLILNEKGQHIPYTNIWDGMEEDEWRAAHPRVSRPTAFSGLPRKPVRRMVHHPRVLQ